MIMKKEIKKIIKMDREKDISRKGVVHFLKIYITRDFEWIRWKYVKYMRKSTYYFEMCEKHKYNIFYKLLFLIYQIKKNRLGLHLGYEIGPAKIGGGFQLFHNGPIVIHGGSTIGENCILHGDNCIGNNGKNDLCPKIGNNVDIGVGAKILGDVFIADNCKIGAGAIVIHSCYEEGKTLVGCPAVIK